MLDGVAGPVQGSQDVSDRISGSFLITPPPQVYGSGPNATKAQQIQEALARAERLAQTLEQLELILDSTLLSQGGGGSNEIDPELSFEIDSLLANNQGSGGYNGASHDMRYDVEALQRFPSYNRPKPKPKPKPAPVVDVFVPSPSIGLVSGGGGGAGGGAVQVVVSHLLHPKHLV